MIASSDDIAELQTCASVTEGTCSKDDCTYSSDDQLRYVILY